jgi:hypothetical protein
MLLHFLPSFVHKSLGYVSLEAPNISQQLSVGQRRIFIGLGQLRSKLSKQRLGLRGGLFRAKSIKETNLPSTKPFAELRSCDFGWILHGRSAVQSTSPPLSYLRPKCPQEGRLGVLVLYLEYCISTNNHDHMYVINHSD